MYFEEAPKREIKDLYDYKEELNQLVEAIEGGSRLIVIEGPRRAGKTSLLLTGLSQTEHPSIVIDAREFSSAVTITRRDLIKALERGLNKFLAEKRGWRERLSAAVKGIQGVEIEPGLPPKISLSWGSRRREALDLVSLLDALGEAANSQGTSFLLAFDEAQEFKRLAGLNLPALMAHVYDYVKGVQWIVTGSQVGVLQDFLGVERPRSPLFGRVLTRIRLKRLSQDDSKEFLKLGFSQISMTLHDHEISTIVEKLDGIIGWLTYVGVVSRRFRHFDEAVLTETMKLGSELAASEFSNFLLPRSQARGRYIQIMRSVVEGPRRWSEIKRFVENVEGHTVPDFTFNQLLNNLVKGSFVEKTHEGLYEITDPILHLAAKDRLF
jgi:AAA+ ATPase superfamily predicted ATPase